MNATGLIFPSAGLAAVGVTMGASAALVPPPRPLFPPQPRAPPLSPH